MYKTYVCPIHGEFEHECSLKDGELKECPKIVNAINESFGVKPGDLVKYCNQPVTRVFKKLTYMDSEGFVGKIYGTP